MDEFPNNLLTRYKAVTHQLKKIQRATFRRFAPNVSEVSEEFNQLAIAFNDSYLPEYAAMCFLGASKCEETFGNQKTQIDYMLKSARAFARASDVDVSICLRSDENACYLDGALRGYYEAQSQFPHESPMKAAVLREMKKYHPNSELTSGFVSPAHRYHDLELSVSELILSGDFVTALEKCTEIYDDIIERNVIPMYRHLLEKNEITRVYLLLLLELPPSRQSPSNIKLLKNVSECSTAEKTLQPSHMFHALSNLVIAWQEKDNSTIMESVECLCGFKSQTKEQFILLNELCKKYDK